jgi:hypothetical protein
MPCPRCFLPKEDIPDLGMIRDDNKRESQARTDTHLRNGTLANARRRIYELGLAVKSAAVERLLSPFSWTPTSVRVAVRMVDGLLII